MANTHTPGPWTYEGDHTNRQFNIRMLGHLIGVKDEAKHICTVNNLPTHVLANRDPSTAEANARLIAAAPLLLSALEQADAYLAPYGDEEDVWHEIRAVMQAAIAKAKGNQIDGEQEDEADEPCPINRRPKWSCPDGCTHGD